MRSRSSDRLKVIPVVHDGIRQLNLRDHDGAAIHHWYVHHGNTILGPFTPWTMRMALHAGDIHCDTQVRRDDCDQWRQASQARDLFEEDELEELQINAVREHHEPNWRVDSGPLPRVE
jgi:hypothetical protein